ncbi:MAG: NifB/NifX family molybdenum-iron cluster-binding protein [Candidatus Aminicenantes bacterium]|nr:NifB/NifX family molybdenum-iron cluster-binding protein [Candidatus Aminicenantes bacterium]MDH5383879.1 NifB/NifX family molybdenum-iron cluster-binding protein [Candidatus Aminicenantes bacterium]MDH5742349.1 NifB/NifX family molybdenum-iron cluster-binding protein [Candidatus Aminicenantes bacterium]
MKIAISTDQGYVSSHFGRCLSYTIVEIKEGQILKQEEIPNPGHQPGFLPQYLSDMGVNCIIAGGMGPRAQALFSQKNIETVIGVQGPIDEVIKKFINQELETGEDLCDHRHEMGRHADHHFQAGHRHRGEDMTRGVKRKICFTSQGKDLHAELDPKFGRAQYFLIIDPRTSQVEVVENPNREAVQGAGILTAQLISSKDVGTVITGHCGPNAQRVLESSGIRVVEGVAGKINDILEKLKTEVK